MVEREIGLTARLCAFVLFRKRIRLVKFSLQLK
jgi:hypothetical protein